MESSGYSRGQYEIDNDMSMVTPAMTLFEEFSDPNQYSRKTMVSARQKNSKSDIMPTQLSHDNGNILSHSTID